MANIVLQRDVPSLQLLQEWYKILPPGEKAFVDSKLGALRYLDRIHLDWSLLQSLLSRWDPSTYSFHFGTLELAPTYEEYLQLSELPQRSGVLPLPRLATPQSNLPTVLRLSAASTHHLVTPEGHIMIEELLKFQFSPYMSSERDGQTSARAFILLFAGVVLYPFTPNSIRGRSVYLARAILEDKHFIPNILGETYFGITKVYKKIQRKIRYHRVSFCLSLLQAWFVTHVGITGYSLTSEHYPGMLQRIADHAYLPTRNFAATKKFMEELTPDQLYPMSRCFKVGTTITSSKNGPYIPIMGISGSSYYVPLRVAHQLGGASGTPPPPSVMHPPIDLDDPKGAKTKTQRSIAYITGVWQQLTVTNIDMPEDDPEQVDATTYRFKRQRLSRQPV